MCIGIENDNFIIYLGNCSVPNFEMQSKQHAFSTFFVT